MSAKNTLITAIAITLTTLTFAPAEAKADSTSNFVVNYVIRDSLDPKTDDKFVVSLELEEIDYDGNTTAWAIARATFREIHPDGTETTWRIDYPDTDLPNDLWWVEHENPEIPNVSEFAAVPNLIGTATPTSPDNDYLQYEFRGDGLTTIPSKPTLLAAKMSFKFKKQEDLLPIEEEEDEPVLIDPPDDAD